MLPRETLQQEEQKQWMAYLYNNYKYYICYLGNNFKNILHLKSKDIQKNIVLFVQNCFLTTKTMFRN